MNSFRGFFYKENAKKSRANGNWIDPIFELKRVENKYNTLCIAAYFLHLPPSISRMAPGADPDILGIISQGVFIPTDVLTLSKGNAEITQEIIMKPFLKWVICYKKHCINF